MSYYLNSNLFINGDLNIESLIIVKGEISGVKPITDLIGNKQIYIGNLKLNELVISEFNNFELNVEGNTTTLSQTYLDKLNN